MKKKKNNIYYTIGHSNHPIDHFIELLTENKINLLVDVRSLPGSRKNPQYNKEILGKTLKKHKINYIHLPKLGGYKKNTKDIDSSINNFWTNKSFKNYADYAYSDDCFIEGLEELIELGNNNLCAIMCAEVLWWRCHRRIITDYLLSLNKKVFHIINLKNVDKATINDNAKKVNKRIAYKQ